MVTITNIEVCGLIRSKIASGLPLSIGDNYIKNIGNQKIYENDEVRAKHLSSFDPGTGHNNYLKGITVYFSIKYPQYFTPQLQRYHWIDIVSSQSKMHTLIKMTLDQTNTNKYVDPQIIKIVNKKIQLYNKNPSYENYMKALSNLPSGFEMWMEIKSNYLQLKTVYNQRKNHKLKEDWGAFIGMINQLPDNFLIIGDK